MNQCIRKLSSLAIIRTRLYFYYQKQDVKFIINSWLKQRNNWDKKDQIKRMWNVIPVVAITKLMVSIATRQCTWWLHPTCWWEDPVWRAGRDLPRWDLGDYLWRQVDLQGSWRHLSHVRRNEVLPFSLIYFETVSFATQWKNSISLFQSLFLTLFFNLLYWNNLYLSLFLWTAKQITWNECRVSLCYMLYIF